MHFDGSQVQNEIYVTGESPWPVGADDWVYGLAVGGQPGVEAVLQQLAAETDLTLALMGGTVGRDLDAAWIAASF